MAAAAVLAVLAGGLGGVRLGVFRAPDLAAVVGGWSASGDARPPAPPPLPVYLIAQRQGRWALVREFTPTTLTRPDDRLGAALRFAVAGAGHAPDLASVWSVEHLLGDVRAEVRAAEVVVRLSATLLGESHQPVSGPARPTLARLAVQQLVWTATAVLGRDAPVRVEGPTPTSVLFDTLPLNATFARGTGATDPRAPIWLSSVTDGQQVRAGALQVSGDALTTGTGTISWALTDAAGTVVARGQEVLRRADGSSPPPRAGERAVFQIHVTLPARGHYVIAVTQDWPSAGDPGATWTDTKTLQAA
ncbi:MAG TPA: hypothetical protein VI248_03185 [Kineosporiaceae bacterium]